MQTVHLPDGTTLNFPDGTSEEVMRSAAEGFAKAHRPALAAAPAPAEADFSAVRSSAASTALLGAPPPDVRQAAARARLVDIREHGDVNPSGHAEALPAPGPLSRLAEQAGLRDGGNDLSLGSRFAYPLAEGLDYAGGALGQSVVRPAVGIFSRAVSLTNPDPVIREDVQDTAADIRKSLDEGFQGTRERFLTAHPSGAGPALGLGTEFAAQSVPFLPGAAGATVRLGEGVAGLAGRLAPETFEVGSAASRMLTHAAGGATFGGLFGYANADPSASVADQAKEIGVSALLGGAMGGLGGAREVAGLEAAGMFEESGRRKKFTLPPPPPEKAGAVVQAWDAERKAAQAQAKAPAGPPEPGAPPPPTVEQVDAQWHPALAMGGLMGDEAMGRIADETQGAMAPKITAPPVLSRIKAAAAEAFGLGPELPLSPGEEKLHAFAAEHGYDHPADLPDHLLSKFEGGEPPQAWEGRTIQGEQPPPGYELNLFGRTLNIPDPVGKLRSRLPGSGEVHPSESLARLGSATVYRESSPASLIDLVAGSSALDARPYMAQSPEMALGQGRNIGVLAEFDAAGLRGHPNSTKPGMEHLLAQGKGEVYGEFNRYDRYEKSLKKVTIDPARISDRYQEKNLGRLVEWLKKDGWSATTDEQGRTTYERPPAALADQRPGEAGFIRLGRPKPPPPPTDPFDAVMPRGEQPAPGQTPLARLQRFADSVTDQWFNREDAPLRRLRRAGMAKEADYLEKLQGRARGAGGMIDPARRTGPVYDGTYVFDPDLHGPGQGGSRRTGDGLQAVIGGMDDQAIYDLDILMAAQHHMELVGRQQAGQALAALDPLAPPPPDASLSIHPDGTNLAQQMLTDLEKRYGTEQVPGPDGKVQTKIKGLDDVADKVRDWSIRSFLIPLKEAGRLSDQEFTYQQKPDGTFDYGGDIVGKNRQYAPFYRLVDRLGEDPEILSGTTKVNPIKSISGGLSPERPIDRPLNSFVQQAQRVTLWIERQRVRNVFADAVDAEPALQAEIVKLAPPAPGEAPRPRGGTFPVWRDGQRFEYAAPADVNLAFERLTPAQASHVAKIASVAARTLRAGATITLEFPFRNLGRDIQDSAVYGPGGAIPWNPLVDSFAGLLESARNGKWAQEWRANGGSLSGATSVARPALEATVQSASRGRATSVPGLIRQRFQAESWAGKIAFPVMAPMEFLAEHLEAGTKIGVYKRGRLSGSSPLDAAVLSRDSSSPDFGRAGTFGQKWNQVEAFSNAELQDLYRFGRAMRRRPVATTVKAMTYLTIPAIANWAKNKDDPEYQNLPDWEKTAFYHPMKLDHGRWVRIPRPLGILNLAFSYGPQKFLEGMSGKDPEAANRFANGFIQQTPLHYLPWTPISGGSLDILPSALQPAVEAAAGEGGYSSFKQGPIVPQGLQGELPEDRFNDYTSGPARAIGGALGVAPLKVDSLIQGYGAYWGRTGAQAVGAAARMAGVQPDNASFAGRLAAGGSPELPLQAQDVPGVRGFVSSSAIGFASDPVTRFYKLSTEASQAKQSMDAAVKAGDGQRFQAIVREHPEIALEDLLSDNRQELKELRDLRREIMGAPGLDPKTRLDQLLSIDQAATQLSGVTMHMAADYLRGQRK